MFSQKHLLTAALLAGSFTSGSQALASGYAAQATFTAPFAHPTAPTSFDRSPYGQSFRWGWFGASHYPPAAQMHRTYNRGWKEWHTRR